MASLASSDSATLTAWLAERRQAAEEARDYDPGTMMSLEEYERVGSWLDLSGDKEDAGTWQCGVPECEIHARHKMMHSGRQVTLLDFSVTEENINLVRLGTRGSSQAFPPSPKNQSSPQIQPRTSRSSMRRPSTSSAMTTDFSPRSLHRPGRRQRENSMPGGWTF